MPQAVAHVVCPVVTSKQPPPGPVLALVTAAEQHLNRALKALHTANTSSDVHRAIAGMDFAARIAREAAVDLVGVLDGLVMFLGQEDNL